VTDPRRRARWPGEAEVEVEVEGGLRPGGEFRARSFTSGREGTGRAEACEPPRHLPLQTTQPGQTGEHVEDLAAHLAGRERCDAGARWHELIPAYQDLAASAG